jgi:hypothetical protein
MKFFRYGIYAFTAIVVICLVVLIIQPEQSQTLRPDATPTAKEITATKTTTVKIEQEVEIKDINPDHIQKSLTSEQLAKLPHFIQSLPKDPREVDSNGNGIRDDIEVFIGFRYPYQPKKRAVYIQMYNIIDKIAKERGRGRLSLQYSIVQNQKDTKACWEQHGLTDQDLAQFQALILNNNYRTEAYAETLEQWKSLDQEVLDSLEMAEKPCDLMIKENQIALQEWTPE